MAEWQIRVCQRGGHSTEESARAMLPDFVRAGPGISPKRTKGTKGGTASITSVAIGQILLPPERRVGARVGCDARVPAIHPGTARSLPRGTPGFQRRSSVRKRGVAEH